MDAVEKPGPASGSDGSTTPRTPRSTPAPWLPESQSEKAIILAQLERLLAHPLFSQSKRYPALLRFVVEQTILGNADQVKERSIGMEVFNRPPGYDANGDPIVRVTAGEIRKRLAQYYYDPAHAEEPRIELPTGSYVPLFQRPPAAHAEPAPPQLATADVIPQTAEPQTAPRPGILTPPQPTFVLPATGHFLHHPAALKPQPHHRNHPYLTVLLVLLSLGLGLAAGYEYRRSKGPIAQPVTIDPNLQALDDFWEPLTAGPATVTFCLGEPARSTSEDGKLELSPETEQYAAHRQKLTIPLYFSLRQSGLFALADTVTLTRLAEPLQRKEKSFRVSAASAASFAQLREGPAVLIGAFDNLWTLRLTRDLRFGFDSTNGNANIIDRKADPKNPSKTPTWSMAWDQPQEKLARDYAIVARYRDATTGQPLVIAAGISEDGTQAAGELISNPAYLANLLRNAPPNWRTMNMEAVIETQVIDGHSGPPQVRAVEFW